MTHTYMSSSLKGATSGRVVAPLSNYVCRTITSLDVDIKNSAAISEDIFQIVAANSAGQISDKNRETVFTHTKYNTCTLTYTNKGILERQCSNCISVVISRSSIERKKYSQQCY